MSWFDEQVRERTRKDNEAFEDAFHKIAGAVMGKRLTLASEDVTAGAKTAMEAILKYYRVRPIEVPPEITDLNERIEYQLRPNGIMHRTVTLQKSWRKDAFGAMLARRKDTGAMTSLIPGHVGGYTFFDETTGRRVRVTRANEGIFELEAMAFYVPFPLKRLSIGELVRYVLGLFEFADVMWFVLATLATTLVGMVLPVINRLLFSTVMDSSSLSLLFAISVFLVCATLSQLLVGTASSLVTTRLSTKMSLSVEAATMMRILSLPPNFFHDYSSGDLASRAQQVNALCSTIVNSVFSTSLTSIFSLAYVGQIFMFAPALVGPSLVVLVLTIAISIVSSLWQMSIARRRMKLAGEESGMGYALISGVRKVKLAGAEKRAFARWADVYARMLNLTYNPPLFLKLNSVLVTAISLAGTIAMYYTAVRSSVSVADYMAFNSSFGMVSGAFRSLSGVALAVANIKPVLERCKPILDTAPEVGTNNQIVTNLSGAIELNNVTFRYTTSTPPVLDDLSLSIRPGQYVAIVGKTGCGKSTLMRILLGFETPQKGAVYYDKRDLTSLDKTSLRRKIGTVMQDGRLMQGSIYSNIVVSAPWLSINDAWKAAELAGIADDIRAMPMGMHTIISEGLGGISGGQRQRLMIARAIAPWPKILIFDEATSALDNITQKKVSESLAALKCTRIVVAHRLSTIRQCDRILVLDGGHIIEDGTYDELIAAGGFFYELVARQRLDPTP